MQKRGKESILDLEKYKNQKVDVKFLGGREVRVGKKDMIYL
jgi:hypothetical protein